MKHSAGFLKIVEDAKSRIKEEDFRETKRRLDTRDKLTLIDVREESEWARGHLPGAVHRGKGVIERDIEQSFPDKDAPLVLYCGGGFRSALAADNLQKMGYTNVISMDGGWRGWTEAGFPTEKPSDHLKE
jgi:rhodanese-related sulfurtransferase